MTTIKDIAKYVGVSGTTVSKVLNNKGNISDETRRSILDAAKALNYIPNRAARSLVGKKTGIIGVVLEKLSDPFYYELINGIEAEISQSDYKLVFCNSCGSSQKRREYVDYLRQGMVDGIILYGSYISDEDIIRNISESKFPLVVIENEIQNVPVNNLLIDNFNGAGLATCYLIGLGHKKIAHIVGNLNIKIAHERMNGYLYSMRVHGIEISQEYIVYSKMSYESGYQSMLKLLNLQFPPTAVFCVDDATACGAIDAAMQHGFKVPADISVVGFDNQRILPPAYSSGIPLTTVRQPLWDIGCDSVKILLNTLRDPDCQKVRKIYQAELLIKNSGAAVAAGL